MTIRTRIVGGVDTHLDTHVAAALDERGGLLGVECFETTPAGYAELHDWLSGFGEVELIGVEGTGSYGVGLARYLTRAGVAGVNWRSVGAKLLDLERVDADLAQWSAVVGYDKTRLN